MHRNNNIQEKEDQDWLISKFSFYKLINLFPKYMQELETHQHMHYTPDGLINLQYIAKGRISFQSEQNKLS
jgi:hypothetical protein